MNTDLRPYWQGKMPAQQAPGDTADQTVCHALDGLPAYLFTPESGAGPWPLLLLGHGGAGSKTDRFTQLLARAFCTGARTAVAVLDGPAHGDRLPEADTDEKRQQLRLVRQAQFFSDPSAVAGFVDEWAGVRDAALARDDVGGPVAYAGFSMGTVLGLPTVAGLGIGVAVFGIGGVPGSGAGVEHLKRQKVPDDLIEKAKAARDPGIGRKIILDAAAKLGSTDVLMINTASDEVFPPQSSLALFDALPGPKRIAMWPGGHIDLPDEAIEMAVLFVAARNGSASKAYA